MEITCSSPWHSYVLLHANIYFNEFVCMYKQHSFLKKEKQNRREERRVEYNTIPFSGTKNFPKCFNHLHEH